MFMRGVVCLSLLLLLVSSAGGFTVEGAEGIPQGYLWSGEEHTLDITLSFSGLDPLSFPSGDILILQTELEDPEWTVLLRRGGGENTLRKSSKYRETISGWELSYPASEEVSLRIRLTGVIPETPDSRTMSIISVRQLDGAYELRGDNEYLVSQLAYPLGSAPSGTPPEPVIITPSPPDLSAFTISSRSTTPTCDLAPGEDATLRTYLSFDRLSSTTFPDTDTLRLRTSLLNPEWAVSIFMNGGENVRTPGKGYYYSLPGFELAYPARDSLGLSVSVTGTVPAASSAPLLEISQCGPDGYAREGAIFVHPAGIALIEETPVPTQVEMPIPTPVVTSTFTPAPTVTVTALPMPSKGEIFPEGITIEALLDLSNELIGHGTLFLKRILSVFGM
ncbi:hypothetical protein [Methanocalculus sp.]|uniref:hypothetical protein n=1 Tax=Methanocalculus sp. TaxID=2004547 RepID=UPI002723AF57|nr:hypothetical protein [Methanocalculus sp.]MDO8841106.1 hypothetical protein [Methanocalculus sp.]